MSVTQLQENWALSDNGRYLYALPDAQLHEGKTPSSPTVRITLCANYRNKQAEI